MRKFFSIVAIIVLFLLATALAGWLVTGGAVLLRDPVMLWGTIAAAAIFLLLAIGLWWELSSNSSRPRPGSAAGQPGERSLTRAAPRKVVWTEPATGRRLPPQYFMFASSPPVSANAIRTAARNYDRLLVGFDSGAIPADGVAAAKEVDAQLEIYVEGPGGVTGSTGWLPDEKARVKAAAASVGVDTSRGEKAWMKEWDAWAWKAFTFKQLEGFLAKGYSAAEIDNLYRVGIDNADALIAFLKEYGERVLAGRLPRLVLKNVDENQMRKIADAVLAGKLSRAILADFHISEKGSGDRKKQQEQSGRIAIRTVESNNTYQYAAKGVFGLENKFVELYPVSAPPAPAPAAPASVPAAPAPAAPAPAAPAPAAPAPATPAPAAPAPAATSVPVTATPAPPPAAPAAPVAAAPVPAPAAPSPAPAAPLPPVAATPAAPPPQPAPAAPAQAAPAPAPASASTPAAAPPVAPTATTAAAMAIAMAAEAAKQSQEPPPAEPPQPPTN